ncbi:hypothetical protein [Mucilaginibacter sp. CSA2-8R]|uniref:hypothetical protein n=1 Tax=Mucilaginibacter sp. CSA2-8R TaxID=3141542 RepID=UPI00315CF75B
MFNLKFALSYFFHQLKAINRHGLHSPFVYRLVDEVIYDFSNKKVYTDLEKALQPRKKLNAADKLLYRLTADWQPDNISVIGKCTPFDQLVLNRAAPQSNLFENQPQQIENFSDAHTLIFIDAAINSQLNQEDLRQLLATLRSGAVLIVKNNHQNNKAYALWKLIKAAPHVTVSIDLFWLGLIYYRPGQVKEDFFIKF